MIVTKLGGIAITVVVVRIVSPHDFGVFAAALIVHTIVSSFAELGVSSCVARRDLNLEDTAPTVAAVSLITGSIFAALVFGLAGPIASVLGAPDAADPIKVLSICVLLTGFFAVPGAMMTRDFRQDRLFLANLAAFVPANGLLILLAIDGDGAMAFAWSRVVGQICVGLVTLFSSQRYFWPRVNKGQLIPILKFGLPLAGANLVTYTLLNADFAFIGRLLGPAALGMYVLAFNIASWSSSVLGSTINSVAMSAFSESDPDPAHLRDKVSRWARLTALVSCPLAAMTTLLSRDIVIGLYGEKWADAAGILSVLAIYGAVFTSSLLLSNLLVATGQSWRVLLIQIIWLLTLVPTLWVTVSLFGVLGAAWAHVIVIVVVVIPTYVLALRAVLPGMVSLLWRATAGPLFASVAAASAASVAINPITDVWWRIGLASLVGLILYLAAALPLARGLLAFRGASKVGKYISRYDSLLSRLLAKARGSVK